MDGRRDACTFQSEAKTIVIVHDFIIQRNPLKFTPSYGVIDNLFLLCVSFVHIQVYLLVQIPYRYAVYNFLDFLVVGCCCSGGDIKMCVWMNLFVFETVSLDTRHNICFFLSFHSNDYADKEKIVCINEIHLRKRFQIFRFFYILIHLCVILFCSWFFFS